MDGIDVESWPLRSARAASIWDSKPVQDKVAMATGTIKEKAPEVADQLSEAARRAGTVIGSAVHREGSSGNGTGNAGSAGGSEGGAAGALGEDHIPAHSTHPETTNLGTTDGNGTKA